jgi:hypothetical protein
MAQREDQEGEKVTFAVFLWAELGLRGFVEKTLTMTPFFWGLLLIFFVGVCARLTLFKNIKKKRKKFDFPDALKKGKGRKTPAESRLRS